MTTFLSGIQPSGVFHIGNYFGAIKQHIEISRALGEHDKAFYFIADYHALTSVKDKAALERSVTALASTYLALGLQPTEQVAIFRQSDIPEVTELNFIFATVTSMAEAERGHAYKDKTSKGIAANVGLFTYPILMAADIAIYDTDVVPVGKDQIQHVEMAQNIVTHFNTIYDGQYLRKPAFKLSEVPKVVGTNGDKMSKSYKNTIGIFSTGKQLKTEIASIVTDSLNPSDPKNPETLTLYQILRLFLTPEERITMEDRIIRGGPDGPGYGEMKKLLSERMESTFGEARKAYEYYLNDPMGQAQVEVYLQTSAVVARSIARKTLARCYEAIGMPNAARRLKV
jgi:tryptophanyl-tRNA synthetase